MSPAFGMLDEVEEVYNEEHSHPYTSDLDDAFFERLGELCRDEWGGCEPLDMLKCWYSESGVRASAHNPGGDASGIFQIMPSTLHDALHADISMENYRSLTATQQLEYARKYYAPHAGHLSSSGACYTATFLPALTSHGGDPEFVLCGEHGPYVWAYGPNKMAFDPDGKGYITVGDLTARINRVTSGNRWDEIASRAL